MKGLILLTVLEAKEEKGLTLPNVRPFTLVDPLLPGDPAGTQKLSKIPPKDTLFLEPISPVNLWHITNLPGIKCWQSHLRVFC